jgi:hypothetical protein
MKSTQDTTPDEVEVDETAGAPTVPIEEIKRKYGPDIIRPASQLPRKGNE